MKLHGQARGIHPLTVKPAGLPVERNPAPKTTIHPRASPWSSGAWMSEKTKSVPLLAGLIFGLIDSFSFRKISNLPTSKAFLFLMLILGKFHDIIEL